MHVGAALVHGHAGVLGAGRGVCVRREDKKIDHMGRETSTDLILLGGTGAPVEGDSTSCL